MGKNVKKVLMITGAVAAVINIIILAVFIIKYNIDNRVVIEAEETGYEEQQYENSDVNEESEEELKEDEGEKEVEDEVGWEDIEEEYVREDPFEEYIDKQSIGQYEIRLERVESIAKYDNEQLREGDTGFMIHLKVKNTGGYAEKFNYDFELESDVEGEIWDIPVQYNSDYLAFGLDEMDTGNVFYYILTNAIPEDSSKVVLTVKGEGESIEFDVSPDMWLEYSGDYYNLPTHLGDVTLPREIK